jgi:hypothetical protein
LFLVCLTCNRAHDSFIATFIHQQYPATLPYIFPELNTTRLY